MSFIVLWETGLIGVDTSMKAWAEQLDPAGETGVSVQSTTSLRGNTALG